MLTLLEVYLKSFKYDVVYDTLNQCGKILPILRKLHLMKAKIVPILHHPPFDMELKLGKADAYVLFDDQFYDYAVSKNSELKSLYFVNKWWPDVAWYERVTEGTKPKQSEAFFIDNGKTRRNHDIVTEACRSLDTCCMMPGNPSESSKNIQYYNMDLKDDISQARRLKTIKSILIPVRNTGIVPMGPYGITSFLDALALKLPVICSDNCCFAHFVSENRLGLVFTTDNVNSLKDAMTKMETDVAFYDECVKNLGDFTQDKSMEAYAQKLCSIFESLC